MGLFPTGQWQAFGGTSPGGGTAQAPFPACQWWLSSVPPPPIAEDFVDAAIDWLYANTGDTFSYIGTGLMPPGTRLPWVRVLEVSDDLQWAGTDGDSKKLRFDHMMLQVSIFADGRTSSKRLGKLVANLLDDAPLAYSDGTHLQVSLADRANDQDEDDGPLGQNVWVEHLTFDLVAQRLL